MIKLAALTVVVPTAIYVISVSDTIDLYREYREVKENAGKKSTEDRNGEFSASAPMLSSGAMMRTIERECTGNKVSVGHFSPEETGREGNLCLVAARLELTGDFVGLLKVLSTIEDMRDVRISSGKFRTVKVGKNDRAVQLEIEVMQMEDSML